MRSDTRSQEPDLQTWSKAQPDEDVIWYKDRCYFSPTAGKDIGAAAGVDGVVDAAPTDGGRVAGGCSEIAGDDVEGQDACMTLGRDGP